jgi:uncharacterized protein (TIGR03084 family)
VDSLKHMVMIDRLATLSLSDPERFKEEHARFVEGTKPPSPDTPREDTFRRIALYESSRLDALSWGQLLAAWDAGQSELRAAALAQSEDAKVAWFAAPMRAETLVNARQMETWGYGQDVFDSRRVRRAEGDRIRNVVEFGLRTMGFSFSNRGLTPPDPKPFVALTAPSGAVWTWNDPSSASRVEGAAVDFCLVATQRRHVADTGLTVTGEAAETWMNIAQCIAGPPANGPRPGERAWN